MKNKRHNMILNIINEKVIETQEELASALKDAGLIVTQATISRDIKELRIVKALDENGRFRYTSTLDIGGADGTKKLKSIFSQSVTEVDCAMNIVVIKTYSGMAPAAAAVLDSMNITDIIGSIAGDDTIIAISRSTESANSITSKIKKLMS